MKMLLNQSINTSEDVCEDYTIVSIRDCIEKTRRDLEVAYAGFDNALDEDMIDSYIFEINSLQKRYKHLLELIEKEKVPPQPSRIHSPVRALVSHVFG